MIRCFLHILNLAVKAALSEEQARDAYLLMRMVRDFIVAVKQSSNMQRELQRLWTAGGRPGTMPTFLDWCDTRWIGVYVCIKRFLELSQIVQAYATAHVDQFPGLSGCQADLRNYAALEAIRDLLLPSAIVSQALQGDKYPTLSLTGYLFYMLKTAIELPVNRNNDSRAFTAFRKAFKKQLKERFPVTFWTDAHLLAMLLDPRVLRINSLAWTNAESDALRERGNALLTQYFTEMRQTIAARRAVPNGQPRNPAPAPQPVNDVPFIMTVPFNILLL